jgi:ABC-2 type transport system ATP-binding protein
MGDTAVVSFRQATKHYGSLVAVDELTFDVPAGRVVGLLGPNGAGKTTTLRMLLGLTTPTAGSATVFGHPYRDLPRGGHRVGVSLDDVGAVPGASARRDLRIWARMLGLPARRADAVLDLVGLAGDAGRPVSRFSTGMRQRHRLAAALLADPELLVLDEPANGLDPAGIRWLRGFLRARADEGRTILLSSHLLAEVAQVVDDVVILQRSLRYSGSLDDLTDSGRRPLEECFMELTEDRRTTHA